MNAHKPTTLLAGMWNMKCPHCREGNLFLFNNPFNLKKFDKMPEFCPVCNQSFFPEVGFYYGAMYMSYMLSIAIVVPVFFIWWALFGFQLVPMLSVISVILIVLTPVVYRYSRVLWIYVTVPFRGNK
ncbi:MAG: DUF983 domain-containing protein [Bacteroidota bacterium]